MLGPGFVNVGGKMFVLGYEVNGFRRQGGQPPIGESYAAENADQRSERGPLFNWETALISLFLNWKEQGGREADRRSLGRTTNVGLGSRLELLAEGNYVSRDSNQQSTRIGNQGKQLRGKVVAVGDEDAVDPDHLRGSN